MSTEDLKELREELKRVRLESEKLLEAASIVLSLDEFYSSAKAVFEIAKELTGAVSGYVALLSPNGEENEVLFLDSGGLPCLVDESLPMPIRGLREVAYREKRPAYDNSFMNSDWVRFMPEGHVELRNVMFGPLIISKRVEGLIGLANKPTDFTEDDARIVMALANLVAIGLKRNKMEAELRESRMDLLDTINELELYSSLLHHDLTNELQLIISELEMNRLSMDKEPQLHEACVQVEGAVSRMLRLLQVFRKPNQVLQDDIIEILRNTIDEAKRSYPTLSLTFHNDIENKSILPSGKALLPFVFDNIIRNAVQHAGESTELNIHLKQQNESMVIDFVDNGPGVDSEVLKKIFTRGISTKEGGGLGLHLCKKIVEACEGTLFLLSKETYGQGAAFRIVLPSRLLDTLPKAH